jgi:hypothetical protein
MAAMGIERCRHSGATSPRETDMTLEEFYVICDSIEPDEYGCHIWPGVIKRPIPDRYYSVNIKGHTSRAHRLALERKLGRPIRSGYFSIHSCDKKACVNQEHLREGTNVDNECDACERKTRSKKYWEENAKLGRYKRQ